MKIWINKLSGAFDIISGLNHYIGMKLIKQEMFPEFRYMIYLFGALIAIGLFAVIMGTRKWLWIYVSILALAGAAGLADFYRWGYDYGHDLDPHAAIQVPGMSYQPPLLGYKNLLNFTAFSGPDIGGVILIASGVLSALILGWEQFLRKRAGGSPSAPLPDATTKAAMMLILVATLAGCDAGAEKFRYGQDECAGCKMIISDQRFGAEIVTRKGKVLKFDDVGCMTLFTDEGSVPKAEIKLSVVSDFNRPGEFIPIEQAIFLESDRLKSPMGSNRAAFATDEESQKTQKEIGGGRQGRWSELANKR
jgi:copper chaperone NosL